MIAAADTRFAMGLRAVLLIAALALAASVYWPGLDGPFLLDDSANIGQIDVDEFSLDDIRYQVTHNASGLLGRPVSMLSLVFTRIVHGPDAWGFKFHNLLVHLLNSLLLFWLLLKLVPRLAPSLDGGRLQIVAGCTAALWLLHPLMVSTVLYAVQRMAQLSSLFTLCALLSYLALRDAIESDTWRRYSFRFVLFGTSQLLAVLSKENGALIPLFVVLVEMTAYRFHTATPVARQRLLAFHGVFVALPVLLGAIYLLTHLDRFGNYQFRDFTMGERVLTQAHVMLFYVKLVLLPAISDMSLFHDGWEPVRTLDVVTLLLLLFWALAAASVFLLRKRAPVLAFGIGWFLIAHLLESTIFDLELVFEHRNYLAAAGLLLALVYHIIAACQPRQVVLLPAIVVPLFLFMTHARVGEWVSNEMIYTLAVRDHPESIRAQTAYASLLYSAGEFERGLEHARIAESLDDKDYGNLFLHMLFLCGRGNVAEIDALLAEATRRAGLYSATPYSFAALDRIAGQIQVGRCPEIPLARMQMLLTAARAQADNAENREFTGFLQRQQGIYFYLQGNPAKGYEHFVLAYENTGLPSILVELMEIEAHFGAFESASNLVSVLEDRNRQQGGTETALVNRARQSLEEIRQNLLRARAALKAAPDAVAGQSPATP